MMKQTLFSGLLVLILAPLATMAQAQEIKDAAYVRHIMQQVEDREDGSDSVSSVHMEITDRFGEKHYVDILRLRRDFGLHGMDQYTHSLITAPAEMAGTRVLTKDYRDITRLDDQWIHIPGINEVKRLSVDNYTSRLMGSDITYGDLSARDLDLYDFTYEGTEQVGQWPTEVISFTPNTQEEITRFGYSAGKVWVNTESWLVVRSIFQMTDAGQSKLFITKTIKQIDGIWMPTDMTFITQKDGNLVSATRMTMNQTRFNVGLSAELYEIDTLNEFTEDALRRLAGF